ncbi:hypothetical protein [Pseudomonas viridiflava]|uniref:hypothetical protein n=1 Tax=Pseudomonas viridiflava TaxID=33069 RepID=UPI000F062977|nr:hypothetical protein [Pseudomonas viridiflava]
MSIKNWTVTTERVKKKDEGLAEYVSYLTSATHKNHKNTIIYPLFNSEANKFISDTIKEILAFDRGNKKGGRKVESYAQSFNFILPPPHKPTAEQWAEISYDLLRVAHTQLNIKTDLNRFVRACFVNVHDQANPHVNVVIPRIFEKKRLADLDRKNILAKMKQEFNRTVLANCNIDHTHYKPLRTNLGTRKRSHKHFIDRVTEDVANASKIIIEAHEASRAGYLAEQERKVKEAELSCRELNLINREYEIKQEKAELLLTKAKFTFLLKAFDELKSSLKRWIESVRGDSYLDTLTSKIEVEEKANLIIESYNSEDEDIFLINGMIDSAVVKLQKEGFDVQRYEFGISTKPKA